MNNKIEEYINNLFLRSPMSTHTKYASQKILTNAFKIYNDFLQSNLNENEAYFDYKEEKEYEKKI